MSLTKEYRNARRRALRLLCALLALFFCSGALAEAPSEYLDGQRDALRRAQQRLIELEILKGSADGAYGPRTEAALREFQSRNGLEQTGHLDAQTLELLTHVSPETATAKDVQQRLIDLGYLRGAADGIIGPRSTEALKLFQGMNGLPSTGKADGGTLDVLFSTEAVAVPATLSPGDKGEAVEQLQQELWLLGFLQGTPDGSYGQSTTNAVRALQEHLIEQGLGDGIDADGVASPMTQYRLFADGYSSYLHEVMPGENDPDALRIERRLAALGYMDMPADDVLDDYAIAALKLFQDQCVMQPDGLADQETFDAIFDPDAPEADHCAPHDIASGDDGLAVRDVQRALLTGGMMVQLPGGKYGAAMEEAVDRLYKYLQAVGDPAAPLFSDSKALSTAALKALWNGLLDHRSANTDDEAEITRIQRRLFSLYYLPKSGVDGKFGRNSRTALKEFQATNGLEETGQPDEATQALLFSEAAVAKLYPYRVEVVLSRQEVQVFQLNGSDEYDLVQTFTCSTGLNNTTPRGIFLDAHPVNRWHHFKKFNCWAQYSFVITGDIMFHSVLYSSNNENSLRSGSLYALGNPASHGCVRLTVADAKWLYEHCKRHTVVVVIY